MDYNAYLSVLRPLLPAIRRYCRCRTRFTSSQCRERKLRQLVITLKEKVFFYLYIKSNHETFILYNRQSSDILLKSSKFSDMFDLKKCSE